MQNKKQATPEVKNMGSDIFQYLPRADQKDID
jgi:hypothetical protein